MSTVADFDAVREALSWMRGRQGTHQRAEAALTRIEAELKQLRATVDLRTSERTRVLAELSALDLDPTFVRAAVEALRRKS